MHEVDGKLSPDGSMVWHRNQWHQLEYDPEENRYLLDGTWYDLGITKKVIKKVCAAEDCNNQAPRNQPYCRGHLDAFFASVEQVEEKGATPSTIALPETKHSPIRKRTRIRNAALFLVVSIVAWFVIDDSEPSGAYVLWSEHGRHANVLYFDEETSTYGVVHEDICDSQRSDLKQIVINDNSYCTLLEASYAIEGTLMTGPEHKGNGWKLGRDIIDLSDDEYRMNDGRDGSIYLLQIDEEFDDVTITDCIALIPVDAFNNFILDSQEPYWHGNAQGKEHGDSIWNENKCSEGGINLDLHDNTPKWFGPC